VRSQAVSRPLRSVPPSALEFAAPGSVVPHVARSQSHRALVLVCPDVVTRVFALPDVLDLTVLLVFLLRVSGRCEPSSYAAGGTQSDRFFLRARHPKADASPGRVTA
jgi:hypothetical protein